VSELKKANRNVRKRILEEAVRLFSERGFDGTSIQLIADAVGIRKPSLLYHFNTKEKLRDEVYEKLMLHWKSELPKLLTSDTSDKDRFTSMIKALVRYFLADNHRSRLSIREMLDRPEIVRDVVREQLNPWVKLICEYIQMGKLNGVVRADVNPEAFVTHVIMLVLGSVAVGNVLAAMFDDTQEQSSNHQLESLVQELERILRTSLFEPQYLQAELKPEVSTVEK